ncbi:MAG: ABC transporter permease [Bacillota bacterium]|jgi:ABC-type transport system involved in multi-copper enzyme maturation permease subunit
MMLKYELKKILNKRMNRVLLAVAMLLMVVFSIFAIDSFRARTEGTGGEIVTSLSAARIMVADKNRWQGELTPEVIAKSVESRQAGDYQSTSDIIYSTSRMLVGEFSDLDDYEAILSADSAQIASIYETYHDNLRAMSEEYGDTPEKQTFLMEQYEKIDTPFTYEAYDSWDNMLMYATNCGLILIIVISFITAGIFAEEFQYKADAVFFSTRYGRSKAVHTKIRAGLIIATLVYGIGIGLLSAISFSVMGTSGASTAYQFFQPYAVYSVTFGQMYGILVLSGYIASLLAASVSMLIASKTKTMSIAIIVPAILFYVSPFLGRALPFRTFFSLTPDQLMNIVNCARIPYIYQVGSIVFRQIPFIIVFYAVIAVAFLPIVYRNYHKLLLK